MNLIKSPTKYRDLLLELVKREVKARYKQSILGYAWVVLVPLANLLILTLVFSLFIRIPTGDIPYPVFLFVGLIPWTFTANSIIYSTTSLISNRSLITKVFVPSEVFPVSIVITRLIDFMLTIVVGLILAFILGIEANPMVVYLPLIFSAQLLLTMGIVFITSSLNVFFRDIENIIGVVITFWMYLSPVIYPQELIPPHLVPYFNLNPMMPIISAYRNTLLYGVQPSWQSFSYAFIFSLTLFVVGYMFFKNRSKRFADVI